MFEERWIQATPRDCLAIGLWSGFAIGVIDALEVAGQALASGVPIGSVVLKGSILGVLSVALYGAVVFILTGLALAATKVLFGSFGRRPRDVLAAATSVMVVTVAVLFTWGNVVGLLRTGSLKLKWIGADLAVLGLALAVSLILIRIVSKFVARSRRALSAIALSILLVAGLLSIGRQLRGLRDIDSSTANTLPNLLLIEVDTLRADYLSSYGYSRSTSPNIDKLVGEGIQYSMCVSPSSSTAPVHASLWTGQFPAEHGVLTNGQKLQDSVTTLAEVLQSRGYLTGGFVTNPVIDARKGFDQGFDFYAVTEGTHYFRRPTFKSAPFAQWWHSLKIVTLADRLGKRNLVTRLATDFIQKQAQSPFFLFVHYFDPHHPYEPPEDIVAKFRRTPTAADGSGERIKKIRSGVVEPSREEILGLEDLYASEVAQADLEVGQVLSALEDSGQAANTLVVFWADHGENLWEHGEIPGSKSRFRNVFGHQRQLFQSLVHVPLVLRWPGKLPVGRRIDAPVASTELRSLVLDLLSGEENVESLLEPSLDRPLFGSIYQSPRNFFVMYRGWKLIRYELDGVISETMYDIEADPSEKMNVLDSFPSQGENLRSMLDAWLETLPVDHSEPARDSELDPETERQLRALGYVD